MPGLAMLANQRELTLKELLDYVEIHGLTKLVLKGDRFASFTFSPDWWKKSDKEREEVTIRQRDYYIEQIYGPKSIITVNGETPIIKQIYTQSTIILPVSENETFGQLKERIEEESKNYIESTNRCLQFYIQDIENVPRFIETGKINAYYIKDLELRYMIAELEMRNIRVCSPVVGDDFLKRQLADELLHPRWKFDLGLFEIEENKK